MFMQYFIPTKIIKLLLLISFSLVLTLSPYALADKLNYQLAHINKNIDVDGVLNEPHWQEATRVAVNYQDEPNEKGTPPVKTDAYIYDDGHNLYVAFVAYDPEPSCNRVHRERFELTQTLSK